MAINTKIITEIEELHHEKPQRIKFNTMIGEVKHQTDVKCPDSVTWEFFKKHALIGHFQYLIQQIHNGK